MFKVFSKIILAAALFFGTAAHAEPGVNIYAHTRQLPSTGIRHQSGQKLSLSDFKGDFVLAMFWSRNCGPCVRELASLNNFYKKTYGSNIRLVMISPTEEWRSMNEQKRFLKRYGAPDLPFYVDDNGKLAAAFGIYSYPHTIIINAQGQEIGRIRGSAQWDDPKVIKYIRSLKASAD